MKKITIIIPVYNASKYIGRCLDSVFMQDYPEIQCILVNDCTPDDSVARIENKLFTYNGSIQFQLLHQEYNKGAAAARNKGIEQADGDYLYFLDADDELEAANSLSLLAEIGTIYENADFIQGNTRCDKVFLHELFDLSGQELLPASNNRYWVNEYILLYMPVTPWNKLIRRNFIIENNLWFQEGIVLEDVLWRFWLSKKVQCIAFCTVYTYHHTSNPDSVMMSKVGEKKRIQSHISILQEYMQNVSDNMKFIESFYILKDFQVCKTLQVSPDNEEFHREMIASCLVEALLNKRIPFLFKPFFLYLFLPVGMLRGSLFLWNKSLGVLFRIVKLKRNTL